MRLIVYRHLQPAPATV